MGHEGSAMHKGLRRSRSPWQRVQSIFLLSECSEIANERFNSKDSSS